MKHHVKVKQRDSTDCGAACLASVAMHYRLQMPLSSIRQYAGTDKQGTNLLGLIAAAEKLGFQAKAAKGQLASLQKIPLPAIAHVCFKNGFQHYLVIYKVGPSKLCYLDPADGEFHQVSLSQFEEIWTGVLVLLIPAEGFITGNYKIQHTQRIWQLIRPNAALLIKAFVAALIYAVLGLTTSIYLQKIIDLVLVEGNLTWLNLLSVSMMVLLLFQLIIGFYKSIFGLQLGQIIDVKLILGYYQHLLKLPKRFFDTMQVGEIISRINDAVKIRDFINSVALSLLLNGLMLLFSLLFMFFYYWKLALMMLAIIPIYVLIYWLSNRVNKKWQRRLMEESAELESQLVESVHSIGTIKQFGIEAYANNQTEFKFFRLLRSIYTSSVYAIYLATSAEFFTRLFTILLLWAGAYFVVNRALSPGELLSFYTLAGFFTAPASAIIGSNKNIQDALISADRLFEIIELETEETQEHKIELTPALMGEIVFHKISFRYGMGVPVFTDLSLVIEKGDCTAMVGESGSGKSTLLSLLQNLYPLNEGQISIGGHPLSSISNRSLRQMIAVVPQQIDLFKGSLLGNIALGDEEPDRQKIHFLANLIGIDEFIEKLPYGYQSLVTEQGVNLSGGQKQRIAIARALYRNPEILILDEATSSLDPASEQKVLDTINWFKAQGKTILIIAHRLSTIKNADKILVLQNGSLVEQGSHQALLQNNGAYSRFWNSQTASL